MGKQQTGLKGEGGADKLMVESVPKSFEEGLTGRLEWRRRRR